jgi:hypothetical protein
MGLLSRTADTFYAFRFLRLLTTPWKETKAYKLGLLDDDGKVIRKPATSEEKSTYNYFHRLVFNVKRLLNKLPLGKTTIASYITALYLLKEETGLGDKAIADIIKESTGVDLSECLLESSSNTDAVLTRGAHILVNDIASHKTGDISAHKGTIVRCESTAYPIGDIFGYPQYEVLHEATNQVIKVNIVDLETI